MSASAIAFRRKRSYINTKPNVLQILLNKHVPEFKWDWNAISQNPNITWDIVANNPDKPWYWYAISRNPNITMDIIANNPNKLWNWNAIPNNLNITMDTIENNPNKPWDRDGISCNPNITVEYILNNTKKNDYKWLSLNTFLWNDTFYKRELVRDIASRRCRLKELLLDLVSEGDAVPWGVAAMISRYIDYA